MGSDDRDAYQSAAGIARHLPLAGAAAGAETDLRKRPGVVEVSFELPDEQLLETIFRTHSCQESVIRIRTLRSSRSRGRDDRDNPNRWWNTTGDWKRSNVRLAPCRKDPNRR